MLLGSVSVRGHTVLAAGIKDVHNSVGTVKEYQSEQSRNNEEMTKFAGTVDITGQCPLLSSYVFACDTGLTATMQVTVNDGEGNTLYEGGLSITDTPKTAYQLIIAASAALWTYAHEEQSSTSRPMGMTINLVQTNIVYYNNSGTLVPNTMSKTLTPAVAFTPAINKSKWMEVANFGNQPYLAARVVG